MQENRTTLEMSASAGENAKVVMQIIRPVRTNMAYWRDFLRFAVVFFSGINLRAVLVLWSLFFGNGNSLFMDWKSYHNYGKSLHHPIIRYKTNLTH